MAIDGALSMKRVLRFAFGLLVNVCILFILVKVFAFGFNFAYDVFTSAIKDVCETLDDAGVVKNAYALMVKIRIGSYAAKIQPGTYEIAPSYTNDQIITVITGGKLDEE
jgi:cell division protein YceG involved in septum cleavage